MLAKETVEGGTAGDAALIGDEAHRLVGSGEERGGMTDAIVVDEVGGGRVGTLVQGVVHIFVVGADEAGQRLVVGVGVGEDGRVFHQRAKTLVQLHVERRVLRIGFHTHSVLHTLLFMLLVLIVQLVEPTVLLGEEAVVAVHAPKDEGRQQEQQHGANGDDAVGACLRLFLLTGQTLFLQVIDGGKLVELFTLVVVFKAVLDDGGTIGVVEGIGVAATHLSGDAAQL